MTIKLVGYDDATIGGTTGKNAFHLYNYTAVASGTCIEIRVKSSDSANIKVAIYADNNGEPGARLAKQDTSTPIIAGWNTIALESSCQIIIGNNYWIGFNADISKVGQDISTGKLRYKKATYSTFTFPDPAGTGFGSYTTTNGIIAGWGDEAAVSYVPKIIVV